MPDTGSAASNRRSDSGAGLPLDLYDQTWTLTLSWPTQTETGNLRPTLILLYGGLLSLLLFAIAWSLTVNRRRDHAPSSLSDLN